MTYLDVQYSQARMPESNYPQQLVDYLRRKLGISSYDHVLELGPGRGDFLKAWMNRVGHVAGLDRDGKWGGTDLTKDRFPMNSASFDVVFSKSVIEHMWDASHMLSEAKRVLRPGGWLIVMTPDWRTQQTTFWDDYTHCRPYDVVSLHDAVSAAGFVDVQTCTFYQYPPIWRRPALKWAATALRQVLPVPTARWLAKKTGFSFVRWSCELTMLCIARSP